VWGYLSAPSDEATNSKAVVGADGDEGFFVGTSDVASNLVPTSNPVPFGPFNANDQVITIKYPAPDSVQTWKVKAPSGSTDQENDIESGPTVEFTVDPSAATGPSGEEYAPNAKDFQVVVTYQDADGGNKTWGFDDSWTNPTEDPRYSLLGGYDVVIEYQDGRKETQDSPARNRTTGSATGWVIPVTTESFKVWLVSWDVNGRRNSIVDGVTPKVVITVGPQMGSAGQEYAALVSGLTAEVTYSKTVDGVEKYTILTKWTNPTDDPAFAGGKIVLRPTSGNDQVLGYVGPLDTEFLWGPYDIGSPITYTPYFVSMDNNGRENTLVPGTTPSAADIIIEAQTTGGLNGGRIDPLTLNPTLGIVGGKLGVPDGALSIASFASTIRPPVLVSAKPTFPDAQYPAGTIFYHTTEHKLYRVKSTGNDWQLAVTGADIVSNSITSGQIAAGAIGTNELFAGEILVGAGGSKPGRFKVVAAGGATAAWVGDDGAGHVGVYAKALWVGPDIDHPQFYCDASGNATFAGALSASVVVLGSQVSGAVGSATTAANAGSATTATTALSAGSMSLASGTKTLYLNTTDWIKMTDSASAWETSFANAYLNIRKTSDATALVELNPYSLKVQYTTNVGFFLGALPYNTGITSVATINNGVNSITLSLPGFMQSGSSRIVMNGTQVLTVQQSAIADLSGAATLADAIAKINAILSMQRVHGLISY
jgi:hypothetical protein